MGVIVRTVTQAWKMYDVQSAPNRAAPTPQHTNSLSANPTKHSPQDREKSTRTRHEKSQHENRPPRPPPVLLPIPEWRKVARVFVLVKVFAPSPEVSEIVDENEYGFGTWPKHTRGFLA